MQVVSAVGFHADSQKLVETCLARLREGARAEHVSIEVQDEIEVLEVREDDETLDVRTDELIIDCAEVKDIPSAASIVRASARAKTRGDVPTVPSRRAAQRPVRWPLVLCGLVATYCGVTAVMRSPIVKTPEVQEIVKTSRAHVGSAVAVTRSLVSL